MKEVSGRAPNQIGRVDAKSRSDLPQYRHAGRHIGALDRADIAQAQPGPVRQFFLRHLLVMAYPTQIDRHDLLEVHDGMGTSVGTIVLGTIVPIRHGA